MKVYTIICMIDLLPKKQLLFRQEYSKLGANFANFLKSIKPNFK